MARSLGWWLGDGAVFFVAGGALVVVGWKGLYGGKIGVVVGLESDVSEALFHIHFGISIVIHAPALVSSFAGSIRVTSLQPPSHAGLYSTYAACSANGAGDGGGNVAFDEFGTLAEAWGVGFGRRVSGQGAVDSSGYKWMLRC